MDYEKMWEELKSVLRDDYRGAMNDVSYSASEGYSFEVFETLLTASNNAHVLSLMKYLEKKGEE